MSSPPAPTAAVRYSTGEKDPGEAKKFNWEYPVPDNRFWADLTFVEGRNYFQSFAPEQQAAAGEPPFIDPESTASREEKLALLLAVLQKHLGASNRAAAAMASASTSPGDTNDNNNNSTGGLTPTATTTKATLYDVDYDAWNSLQHGIFTIKHSLGHEDAEDLLREMIDRRKYRDNLSHQHTLSTILFDRGAYAEAEATELPVLAWLDGRLGKDSPQALGSRRIIGRSIWKQGPARRGEAMKMFEEARELIEGLKGSKYEVYQEEQRELTEKMVLDLEEGRL